MFSKTTSGVLETSIIGGPYLKKDINAHEQVQHRATKMITSLRKLPYEQRLKSQEYNLTTLEERWQRGDLLETHLKIMHGCEYQKLPSFRRWYSEKGAHFEDIGGPTYKERSKREPRRNFFSHRVVIPWNALPEWKGSLQQIYAAVQDRVRQVLGGLNK